MQHSSGEGGSPRIVILGAGGRLGAALARAFKEDSQVLPLGRQQANLSNPLQVVELVRQANPSIVINCAAMTNVDACETERALAATVNAEAPGTIAAACTEIGARLIHISTDYVFSGEAGSPYAEDAVPGPLSWYGETKLQGELAVLAAGSRHDVVRVSWVFGPDRDSFVDKALQTARRGEPVKAVADKISSPTCTMDVAAALRPLFAAQAPGGIYHVCNQGACTWQDWAQAALDAAIESGINLATQNVEPIKLADLTAMMARRPVYSAMSCRRIEELMGGRSMRPWREAVRDYVRLLVAEGRLA